MTEGELVAESAARRYAVLRPHLDERQRRLVLGVEARELGRGGIRAVAEATGVHPDTVTRYIRQAGGHAQQRHEELVAFIESIMSGQLVHEYTKNQMVVRYVTLESWYELKERNPLRIDTNG